MCVTTEFMPYFFVKLPVGMKAKDLYQRVIEKFPYVQTYSTHRAKDLWGFQNNQMHDFVKFTFKTLAQLKECESLMRFKIKANTGGPLHLYETNIAPVRPFLGLQPQTTLLTSQPCFHRSSASCTAPAFSRPGG